MKNKKVRTDRKNLTAFDNGLFAVRPNRITKFAHPILAALEFNDISESLITSCALVDKMYINYCLNK